MNEDTKKKLEELKISMSNQFNSTTIVAPRSTMPVANEHGMIGIKGVLVIEGEMTGDGRYVDPGAVYWEEGPWSLMGQVVNDGHKGAPLVGRIDSLARMDNRILFEGVIDMNIEDAAENARLINNKLLRGISLDPDMFEPELRTEDGRKLDELSDSDLESIDWDKVYMAATSMRVRGGTMLPMPAFVDTELELFEVGSEVASGFPDNEYFQLTAATKNEDLPPMWWFQNPGLGQVTPLTIDADGHIYGHIVQSWNQCHMSFSGKCITPPHSKTGYAYYTRGAVRSWCEPCEKMELVAVGPITAVTGHARGGLSKEDTIAHYDNSGSVVAEVAAGEDNFGIWISGRVSPNATKAQIDLLLAIGVSGDWRRVNGNLELVAVLSVPVPGYPIPRKTQAHVASGVQTALITGFSGGSDIPTKDESATITSLTKAVIGLLGEKIKGSNQISEKV